MNNFDICIVGAGMVGSAAAKYCAINGENKKLKILLIGPDEPERDSYGKEEIFGAHFDEGRITRRLDIDPVWVYLSSASIPRYRDIEQESGVKFYTENGFLRIYDRDDPSLEQCIRLAAKNKVEFSKLDNHSLVEKFPFLNPLPESVILYEQKLAGSINPRLLVKAQKIIASKLGVKHVKHIVIKLNSAAGSFEIKTKQSGNFISEKVILCVGAYLFHYPLLPENILLKKLNVKCGLISTARIPVNLNIVSALSTMPTVTLVTKRHFQNLDSKQDDSFYMMQPILYPDGLYYLKLGFHSHARKGSYGKPEEITDWFRNGQKLTEHNRKILCEIASKFIPRLKADWENVISDTCAITETPRDRPYVDQLTKNLFIVTGCNGFSAKSSDEFGRLVGRYAVDNVWDCSIEHEQFKCLFSESKL